MRNRKKEWTLLSLLEIRPSRDELSGNQSLWHQWLQGHPSLPSALPTSIYSAWTCRRCCRNTKRYRRLRVRWGWSIANSSCLAYRLRGQSIQLNAFLDDGSDSPYVRDDIVTALGLQTNEQTLRLTTLTENCIPPKSKKVSLTIKSPNGENQSTAEAWTLNEMCQGLSIPDWNRHKVKWGHLKKIPFPKAPGKKIIDILIGSDHPELTLALKECYGPIGAQYQEKRRWDGPVLEVYPPFLQLKWLPTAEPFGSRSCTRPVWMNSYEEIDSLGVGNLEDN